jgi:hypothetical protein
MLVINRGSHTEAGKFVSGAWSPPCGPADDNEDEGPERIVSVVWPSRYSGIDGGCEPLELGGLGSAESGARFVSSSSTRRISGIGSFLRPPAA